MLPSPITAADLGKLLGKTVFRFANERDLQDGIVQLLERESIPFTREVVLSPRNRIDFLIGGIGVEVKVDSSSPTVARQLARYAADDRIESLLLVTSRSKHRSIATEIEGKPVLCVHLLASIF